ncbi:MAG: cellobiose phosphorylase [Anaerolineales bacterium]
MNQSDFSGWEFIDDKGTFRLYNPHRHSSLYFPLVNDAGIFSAVTPTLHGDIKADHNSFLTPPVSVESLHDSRSARNFWVQIDGVGPWSVTGNSAAQFARHFTGEDEESILEAGFLWQRVIRKNIQAGLKAEVTSFVPASSDRVELMKVTFSNLSGNVLKFTPTAAIPIYGRSADNLRDHRHVTSLLHRTHCGTFGVLVSPTLSFDERGHQPNLLTYAVLGVEEDGTPPLGFFPIVEDFIGEGGSLDWPQAIVQAREPEFLPGMQMDGHEAIGGLRFRVGTLLPGEQHSFILMLAIMKTDDSEHLVSEYGNLARFDAWLEKTQAYWQSKLDVPRIYTGDTRFEGWLRWVTVQPVLRRFFGNSFLPSHDYGRGGRGWRDLWQDILALLMMESDEIGQVLFDNFGGVRMDGSNATIIGPRPGEFKADRNNIPRVWMDHGAWPLLTTGLYIDQTGDLAFLLRSQVYFKDYLAARAQRVDSVWSPEQGTVLRMANGNPYQGTILEHLLVQHLVPFFNVGEHNNIRLEGADWNDAMDMASQRGESVAFSALYAGNIHRLSEWVLALGKLGVFDVEVAEEMLPLLDTLAEAVDYDSVAAKQTLLAKYFDNCMHTISGRKISLPIQGLAADLSAKSEWLCYHLRIQEWLTNSEGYGWLNGYYDNDGMRVEGDFPKGVRMTLTGQVFALMGGVASDEQANEIVRSVDHYLYDARVGGYRLNTDFGEVLLNLGRGFGFAYGHKENGAMFSHMAVMYANALYQRGLVRQGYKVLDGIYQHCQDFFQSHIYPGIPEYINERGRGMYTYLTGSASWYLLTLVTEAFGVRGKFGDLVLEPKLVSAQFDRAGEARLITRFANREIIIIYHNRDRLDYGNYQIHSLLLDGQLVEFDRGALAIIPRSRINSLNLAGHHSIEIELR